MEYIIANADRIEEGYLTTSRKLDFDIGSGDSQNDFELAVSHNGSKLLDFGKYVFAPGTEYGGPIEELAASTASGTTYWRGYTWRGLLDQIILEPKAGEAYLVVAGEVNSVLAALLKDRLGNLFEVSSENTGVQISYQFSRYTTLLKGVSQMLAQKMMRLNIWAEPGKTNGKFTVRLEAVPVTDYSEELEFNQDCRVSMDIEDRRRGINHLICLGQGELTERQVVHLYAQADGSVGSKKHFDGFRERVAVYDYSSAEDLDSLTRYGTTRLKEIMDCKALSLTVKDIELAIGDIVAGRERTTGAYLRCPVVRKILRVDGLSENIEYSIEGEN